LHKTRTLLGKARINPDSQAQEFNRTILEFVNPCCSENVSPKYDLLLVQVLLFAESTKYLVMVRIEKLMADRPSLTIFAYTIPTVGGNAVSAIGFPAGLHQTRKRRTTGGEEVLHKFGLAGNHCA
jgi:hypothetical protein